MEHLFLGISLLMAMTFFWLLGWLMGRQHEHKAGTPSASHKQSTLCSICQTCRHKIFLGGYMSRYRMFQDWWDRATSGPSDFRIDKRSTEIGFEAALDIMEKNLTAHNISRDAASRSMEVPTRSDDTRQFHRERL